MVSKLMCCRHIRESSVTAFVIISIKYHRHDFLSKCSALRRSRLRISIQRPVITIFVVFLRKCQDGTYHSGHDQFHVYLLENIQSLDSGISAVLSASLNVTLIQLWSDVFITAHFKNCVLGSGNLLARTRPNRIYGYSYTRSEGIWANRAKSLDVRTLLLRFARIRALCVTVVCPSLYQLSLGSGCQVALIPVRTLSSIHAHRF
jgi:hypothetical protein